MDKKKLPVSYNGKEYYGIKKFDCLSICLFTEPTLQGTFFTSFAISKSEYREKNPTKAEVIITKNKHWTIFNIYDDWGSLSVMKISNKLKDEIEFAKQSAIKENLCK